MKKTTRRFTNKKKFGDDTKYMECRPNGKTIRVSHDGEEHHGFERHYSLYICLQQVWQGKWVEILKYKYQPPKSTITDHLRDCFGWLTC